jgi:SAM-dependent methyltransferase
MLKRLYFKLRSEGFSGVMIAARRAVAPVRARSAPLCREVVQGRRGLEVGGPSGVFRPDGLLPAYPYVGSLDNCNFAARTTWEGDIAVGRSFLFAEGKEPGMQYVAETTDLSRIASGTYDFLLSSHVIEHTANPLRALDEWLRVLTPNGVLVLLVPHRDGTFDHRRPVTDLGHLVDDMRRGTGEDDRTHLDEILALHDLRRDPAAGGIEAFRERSQRNTENRCLHHHVFDTRLVGRMLDHAGLQLMALEASLPSHVIAIARKVPPSAAVHNAAFLMEDAAPFRQSPFPTDRGSR